MKTIEVDQHIAINADRVAYYTIYPGARIESKKITIYFISDIAPLTIYVDDHQALRFHNAMLNAGGY